MAFKYSMLYLQCVLKRLLNAEEEYSSCIVSEEEKVWKYRLPSDLRLSSVNLYYKFTRSTKNH